jgi:hypothetical protein
LDFVTVVWTGVGTLTLVNGEIAIASVEVGLAVLPEDGVVLLVLELFALSVIIIYSSLIKY